MNDNRPITSWEAKGLTIETIGKLQKRLLDAVIERDREKYNRLWENLATLIKHTL